MNILGYVLYVAVIVFDIFAITINDESALNRCFLSTFVAVMSFVIGANVASISV